MGDPLFIDFAEGSEDPYPVRQGCRVTPLIESAAMYPLLERELLSAQQSVWLAFRVFDPTTKLRSEEALAAGHATWLDLIAAAVERGVEVRILLTDFEPILADYLHASSWGSFRTLRERLDNLPEAHRKLFQMIVIQHEGEIGWGWRQLLRLNVRKHVRGVVERLLDKSDRDERVFDIRPGLWRWLSWKDSKPHRWRAAPPRRLWPATYHQKCAVIDGCKAIIGGLDLDERRWDNARHNRQADETWHDVSSLVEGALAGDAADHFMSLWNRELPRFKAIVEEWTDTADRELVLEPLTAIAQTANCDMASVGGAETQLVRTMSRKSPSSIAVGPKPDIREIKEAHRKVFALARNTLYIEAQFFRSRLAAGWLIEALKRNPALEVIILIANVPEEIAFLGQSDNPVHRYGEHLQARALTRILAAGGPDRVGLFTLVKHEKADRADRKFEDSRGTAYGSGVIHIHAKLLIADEETCLLSSANINGRSFNWDTELGFIWRQTDGAIGRFRDDLWGQLFGGKLPPAAKLADWHRLAEHNRTAEPDMRHGFVVPYQRSRARRFGARYFLIPDSLV